MRRYEFKIWLSGYGETEEDAWEDAVEAFMEDPGSPPSEDDYEVYDDEDEE